MVEEMGVEEEEAVTAVVAGAVMITHTLIIMVISTMVGKENIMMIRVMI